MRETWCCLKNFFSCTTFCQLQWQPCFNNYMALLSFVSVPRPVFNFFFVQLSPVQFLHMLLRLEWYITVYIIRLTLMFIFWCVISTILRGITVLYTIYCLLTCLVHQLCSYIVGSWCVQSMIFIFLPINGKFAFYENALSPEIFYFRVRNNKLLCYSYHN